MTALTSQALGHRSPDSASQQGTRAVSLADEDRRLLEDAERALADRPNITMSLRISMSMLLCFLLVVGVVVASMVLVSKVGTLQEYLDKVSTYALEVENTRRYEKNYLLYGTGLDDALTQVQAAQSQLHSMKASMVDLTGPQVFERMEENLEQYGRLLERLAGLGESTRRRGTERTHRGRERISGGTARSSSPMPPISSSENGFVSAPRFALRGLWPPARSCSSCSKWPSSLTR